MYPNLFQRRRASPQEAYIYIYIYVDSRSDITCVKHLGLLQSFALCEHNGKLYILDWYLASLFKSQTLHEMHAFFNLANVLQHCIASQLFLLCVMKLCLFCTIWGSFSSVNAQKKKNKWACKIDRYQTTCSYFFIVWYWLQHIVVIVELYRYISVLMQ